jgi:hypothetical protein
MQNHCFPNFLTRRTSNPLAVRMRHIGGCVVLPLLFPSLLGVGSATMPAGMSSSTPHAGPFAAIPNRAALHPEKRAFPPGARWIALLWLCVWFPAYWRTWGAVNFLHFCDISVIVTCAGFILESPLLIASQAVASILVDLMWIADILCKLTRGHYLLGGTEYMFDTHIALWIRLLSLFHVVMPILLLWTISRVGYERRGIVLQCAIAFAAFIGSRFTNPALNMNYAFSDPFFHRQWGPAPVHVLLILAFMLIVVYLPTHLFLMRIYRPNA